MPDDFHSKSSTWPPRKPVGRAGRGSPWHELRPALQRVVDIVAAGLGLIVLLPLGIPLLLALRLTGEGKVLYRQTRLGYCSQPFEILKLATMLDNSENMSGGRITLRNDPRLTPLGGFLRRTKLNELPQLWNVLIGDMTIVGPRPLPAISHEWYTAQVRAAVAAERPGVTGIASLVFRDEEALVSRADTDPIAFYRDVIFPYKGRLELWYYQHKSLATDVKIVALTLGAIAFPKGDWVFRVFPGLPERPRELRFRVDDGTSET